MSKNDKQHVFVPRLRFPEFRDSPEWSAKPLGSVAQFVTTKMPMNQVPIEDYVSTENIRPDYGGIEGATRMPPSGSVTQYKPDDVLFANIRPYLRKVWRSNKSGGASNDVLVIRAKPILRSDYLPVVLANDAFVHYVMKTAKGVKMPRGDIASMKAYSVYYPKPAEQQKIADCLGSLDELIAAEGRMLAALRDHKNGMMQQVFPREGETRPRLRLPEFRDAPEWDRFLLEQLEDERRIELGRGKVISHDDMRANPGPHPVYSSSVIDNGLMGTYGDYLFDEELISWSVDGGGHFFYRPKHKFSITNVSGFIRVLSDDIICQFLAYQLHRLHASETFNYVQKAHPSVIRTLYTVGVPDPSEQQRIADCLSAIDALIATQAEKLDALRTHKRGLMQQLFPSPDGSTS